MEHKKIYLVYVNSDLTEGRGMQYPKYACEKRATAVRLSEKADVQGTNGKVFTFNSPKIDGQFLAPYLLIRPTKEDELSQKKLDEEEKKRKEKEAVLEKLKSLGVTDEEIEALRN